MYTYKSQKSENLCKNGYFLLFFAKKSRQKRLRLTKNAVLLLPRSGGAKKNSPHYGAGTTSLRFRLAQTLFGFIRLHSSKTCIFLRPVLPHLGKCTLFQISKHITKNKSVRLYVKTIHLCTNAEKLAQITDYLFANCPDCNRDLFWVEPVCDF
jgi:hypothetical protein